MLTFMAGATTTGPVKARYSVVRKSSGQAVGHLGHQVGGGGRHHQQIVFLRHADVFDGAFDGEQVGQHLAAGERGEGQRPDELLRGRGHDRLHLVALLHQQARQFGGLISRDAAADAQDDLHRSDRGGLQHRLRAARSSGAWPVRLYFTRPRRTSSIGDDGGLLRGCGQHRPRAALQLPGPLGRHDDEPVGALLGIVRNGAVRVVASGLVSHDCRYLFKL